MAFLIGAALLTAGMEMCIRDRDRELPTHVYEEIMENVLPKRAKLRCMNLLKSR